MNKLPKILSIFSFILCFGLINVFAQYGGSNITRHNLNPAEIEKIIKNIADKEGEFREALKNYVFNRYAVIQTVGLGGQVTGDYRRDSYMSFNSD